MKNSEWSVGDRIGIVPTEGSQLYFEVEQGDVPTATFDGGSWSLKTGHTFWAYYPLYPDMFMTKEKVAVSFGNQVQTGNNNNSHVGSYMCLYTDGTSTSTDALYFQFHHLTSFFKTYVTVPAGKYTKVEFKAPSAVFIKNGWFNVASDSPSIVGSEFTDIISVELKDVEFSQPTELTAYAVVAPVDISNIPITVTVFGEDGAYSYTLSKTSPMSIAVTYAFRAQSVSEAITSESAANSAFASGETDVNFAAIDDADGIMDLVLPNTTSDVSISLPLSETDMEMNISYPAAAVSYPDTIKYSGPATSDVSLDTPHSTVVLKGVSYGTVVARTAPNTIIVEEGVIVEELDVLQGSVTVYGTVDTIDLSDDEDASAVVHIYGTVDEILGEDEDDIIIWHNGNVPFEDANFKAYCVANFDTDGDGEISISEAEDAERIVVVTNNIESLGGLEYFINLKYLECTGSTVETEDGYSTMNKDGLLETLDISQNKSLIELICWGNKISTLDASNLTSLTVLSCSSNNLTELNVSGDTSLTILECADNQLSSLDASNLSSLKELLCAINNLSSSSLDFSADSSIETLYCYSNQISSLDVSGLPMLEYLSCEDNQMQSLTISGNDRLISLWCPDNQLTSLDISEATSLRTLHCYDNQLSSLDVSNNNELRNLYCSPMSTLDTLLIASGQSIPNVTVNRNAQNIPSSTEIVIKSTPMPQPEAIDLGLSVKWASFNVGASAPEEYGDYYAWGEVEPKSEYLFDNYKWSDDNGMTMTKYCTDSSYGIVDGKTILDSEDDVAYIKLGNNWRMPTLDEFQELIDNCDSEWTAQNGVYGRKLVSRINGNSIFLPAAGADQENDAGLKAYYWSANTLGWGYASYFLYFTSSYSQRSYGSSCMGRSVRAVQDYVYEDLEQQNMEDINLGDTWQWQ